MSFPGCRNVDDFALIWVGYVWHGYDQLCMTFWLFSARRAAFYVDAVYSKCKRRKASQLVESMHNESFRNSQHIAR